MKIDEQAAKVKRYPVRIVSGRDTRDLFRDFQYQKKRRADLQRQHLGLKVFISQRTGEYERKRGVNDELRYQSIYVKRSPEHNDVLILQNRGLLYSITRACGIQVEKDRGDGCVFCPSPFCLPARYHYISEKNSYYV